VTKKLRQLFPQLFGGQYQLASGRTKRYNCLAWAAGHNDAWWEAPPNGVWPPGVLDDGTVEAAIQLFENLGYTRTDNSSLEVGVDKVAIYGDKDGYTHAARQLPNGKWASKIGKLQDIEHDSLDALSSVNEWIGTVRDKAYGRILQIMRKTGPSPGGTPPP
jgi:hypothetical protein